MFFLVQGHEAILVTFEYLIDSYFVTLPWLCNQKSILSSSRPFSMVMLNRYLDSNLFLCGGVCELMRESIILCYCYRSVSFIWCSLS